MRKFLTQCAMALTVMTVELIVECVRGSEDDIEK